MEINALKKNPILVQEENESVLNDEIEDEKSLIMDESFHKARNLELPYLILTMKKPRRFQTQV